MFLEHAAPRAWRRAAAILVAAACAAACAESAPPGPADQPDASALAVRCTVDVAAGVAECGAPTRVRASRTAPLVSAKVIGGQNVNVRLEQMSFTFDAGTRVLSSNVRLTNLSAEAMGTTTGTTPAASGIRLFFHSAPTNGVQVLNADGTGIFTGVSQPYFSYPAPLLTGGAATRSWRFSLPAGVSSFAFQVLIDADVPGSAPPPPPPPPASLQAVSVVSGLSSPLYLTAPAGDPRLFIVEQVGRIRVVKNGQLLPTPFLDVQSQITSGGEQGLLSVAFHPEYATNGAFFIYYTDLVGNVRIDRRRVSAADPDVADASPSSVVPMLTITHPSANHTGGLLKVGPAGLLGAGVGDGGGGGDPLGSGQNRNTLLGKILRLDVDGPAPYAIPKDNPFAGGGGLPEIWAIGVRNPWRFAFDRPAGMFYLADVGQALYEEIDVVPVTAAGLNYGWVITEGPACYSATTCNRAGLTDPVFFFDHSQGCSITGGYVYRGTRMPGLVGTYFYSDFCSGWLRSIKMVNGVATEPRSWTIGLPGQRFGNVLSFGEDSAGELYALTAEGVVWRLDSGAP